MKRLMLVLVILMFPVTSAFAARITLGLHLYNTIQSDPEQFSLTLGPVLGIYPSDNIEIAPVLAGIYWHDENNSNGGMLAACGLYFHPLNTEHFSLSLGPYLYVETIVDDYFSIGVAMPVNCDLLFTEKWTGRLSITVADFNYWDGGRNNNTSWNLMSSANPGFTLMYTF